MRPGLGEATLTARAWDLLVLSASTTVVVAISAVLLWWMIGESL